ncbi:MAG: hypothetical protein EP330_22840 [Deltaproteobacteria bacterium]|nr:MAG: hypothetical protein EP330_22840 [Deltaproteobacteria bacterium]
MSWRHIDHVVVLMMENQSFDRILGWMNLEEHDVDGVPTGMSCPIDDADGCETLPVEGGASLIPPGAPHRAGHMFEQFHGHGPGTNRGFARMAWKSAWKRAGLKDENKKDLVREVLRHHDKDDLPVTRDLALSFAVADRWFCSIASSTWPNRYFLHYGTSPTGPAHFPQLDKNVPTLFKRLNDKGLPWRIYVDGPANVQVCAAISKQRRKARKQALANGVPEDQADPMRTMDRFFCDFAPTPDGFADNELPAYTFIEPRHWRAKGREANNDHSGTHLHRGQALIAQVYNRLREHPAWERTLLVVTYDEHGGYYDHVAPPPAPNPETGELGTVPKEGDMGFYGGRVPTLLISPRIKPGAFHEVCDHTSVLAFLEKRFDLEPLTHRDAQANDLTSAFTDEPWETPKRLEPPPEPEAVAWAEDWRSDHTELELDLYRHLAGQMGDEPEREIAKLDADTLAELGEARAAVLMRGEVV